MKQDVFPARQGARKRRSQWLAFGIFKLLSYSIVLILFAILGFIIYKGIGVISWEFLTTAPSDGMTGGGIWPAIVGTFYLMVGSALFAFPVGVMSGIYMNEYAPKGKLVRFIRMMTNNLSGIPSIVFGLFGMALFVKYMGFTSQKQSPGQNLYPEGGRSVGGAGVHGAQLRACRQGCQRSPGNFINARLQSAGSGTGGDRRMAARYRQRDQQIGLGAFCTR